MKGRTGSPNIRAFVTSNLTFKGLKMLPYVNQDSQSSEYTTFNTRFYTLPGTGQNQQSGVPCFEVPRRCRE